jgi:two-component system response regulator PilR (NtrC family)
MNATAATILVVDDEPDLRTLYELTLLREGYRVETAGSVARRASCRRRNLRRRHHRHAPARRLGLELLHDLRAQQRPERCVVMTAYGSAENAVEALRGRLRLPDQAGGSQAVPPVVASAVQGAGGAGCRPASRSAPPRPTAQPGAGAPGRRVGGHARVKQRIAKVARGMAPVLRGESGTGKELVARALHACSQRAEGPLVAVNCGAIPRTCSKPSSSAPARAPTPARQDRDGYFQAARGGTLFLDEIGDLPLAMQSKLLRAIQERSVRPLGSTQEETVDVRIVSATHRDLAADVQAGRFRQDLYYRLNVIELLIPRCASARRPARAVRHAAGAHWAGSCLCPAHRTSLAGDCHPPADGQRARAGERAAPRSGID